MTTLFWTFEAFEAEVIPPRKSKSEAAFEESPSKSLEKLDDVETGFGTTEDPPSIDSPRRSLERRLGSGGAAIGVSLKVLN